MSCFRRFCFPVVFCAAVRFQAYWSICSWSHTTKVDKGEGQEVWQPGGVHMEFNSKERGCAFLGETEIDSWEEEISLGVWEELLVQLRVVSNDKLAFMWMKGLSSVLLSIQWKSFFFFSSDRYHGNYSAKTLNTDQFGST